MKENMISKERWMGSDEITRANGNRSDIQRKVITTRIASTARFPSSAQPCGSGPRSTAPFGFSTVWRGNIDVPHWGECSR